jgi:hypothetical protein
MNAQKRCSQLSAIRRPWRLHLNFSCQVESNGWFSAIKLIARISGPGQEKSLRRYLNPQIERQHQPQNKTFADMQLSDKISVACRSMRPTGNKSAQSNMNVLAASQSIYNPGRKQSTLPVS